MGSEAYGSSMATTYVGVSEATPEAPAYKGIDLAIIAAVAVAIVIDLVNLYALRKQRK